MVAKEAVEHLVDKVEETSIKAGLRIKAVSKSREDIKTRVASTIMEASRTKASKTRIRAFKTRTKASKLRTRVSKTKIRASKTRTRASKTKIKGSKIREDFRIKEGIKMVDRCLEIIKVDKVWDQV